MLVASNRTGVFFICRFVKVGPMPRGKKSITSQKVSKSALAALRVRKWRSEKRMAWTVDR